MLFNCKKIHKLNKSFNAKITFRTILSKFEAYTKPIYSGSSYSTMQWFKWCLIVSMILIREIVFCGISFLLVFGKKSKVLHFNSIRLEITVLYLKLFRHKSWFYCCKCLFTWLINPDFTVANVCLPDCYTSQVNWIFSNKSTIYILKALNTIQLSPKYMIG